MNTCETCKHWNSHPDEPYEGSCLNEKIQGISDSETVRTPHDGLVASSGFDCSSAWIVTGPDFGCIHHTPK